MLPPPCPDKTRADLEWDRVQGAVAERCVSGIGAALARGLPFPDSVEGVLHAREEAREAVLLDEAQEPIPMGELPDVRDAAQRLRIGGVLAAGELCGLGRALGLARALRRFLHARRERAPALFAACSTDPTLDAVEDELSRSFEADGTLSDRASPRLAELRSEHQTSRARMLSRLEDLMGKYKGILQDRFVTEREGRYVVPLRSDAHERFPGIVHATSGSGSTIFVEPRAVVPLGNRLKMLEAEVAREELLVFTRLSALLADVLPSVEAAVDALARADVCGAVAKLARELSLTFPEIVEGPAIELAGARHPLLALDARDTRGGEVVASDLAIKGGHGMIVSGPNAGGKTVALKAMGLAALMTRAGLPVACTGGNIGVFDVVLTDVGDEQSLSKNLSTFSAHVRNLAHILEETRPGALVLLDELAGGTDPREGEALAAGVLDSLCARGGAVVATTHYEGLKALALADPRFVNASVGFDLQTMTPTFRLAIGVPGSSSALAVAARYGLPSTVLERAQRFLSREDQNFESLVKRLNGERAALELARHAAEEREREAAAAKTRLATELAAAQDRERREVSREALALVASLRRAKDDLRAAQAKLRTHKPDDGSLKEAARAIDRVAAQVAIGGELEEVTVPADATPRVGVRREDLRKGARVYVPRLRAEAEVLEVSASGAVRVAVGPMKLSVAVEELWTAPEPDAARGREAKRSSYRRESRVDLAAAPPLQTTDNTCDLRGLRADDAVTMATTFLDRCLSSAQSVCFLIHGHGTGALREAVRKELRQSPYVAQLRGGESGEGGDGVTVVWLA